MVDSDSCTACGGRKHVLNDQGCWVPCKCLIAQRHVRACVQAGIPKYVRDMTWQDWLTQHPKALPLQDDILAYIKALLAGTTKRSRCVCGKSNSGKLTMAHLVLNTCINNGMAAKITTLSQLVEDGFNGGELVTAVLAADVACIRLGMEKEHKFNPATLEQIHFTRKADNKPTFYTTRYQANDWQERYGSVLADAFWMAGGDAIVWDLDNGRVLVP